MVDSELYCRALGKAGLLHNETNDFLLRSDFNREEIADQMLGTLLFILSTSYIAWYFEHHELAVIYPFDQSYVTPEDVGASDLNETSFQTKDGARLVVWQAQSPEGLPTVIYFSGNAGSLKDRAARFNSISELGFGLVAPAYRGSSGSTGQPTEVSLLSDAEALAKATKGEVIIYGESLGAAIAIHLAAKGIGDAVVLEAPFTSLVDLVEAQYPTESLRDTLTQRWDSLSYVASIKQPLLVIHGETDRLVPFEMGRAIFEAAGSETKEFVAVEGHGHTQLWTPAVRDALFKFFRRSPEN